MDESPKKHYHDVTENLRKLRGLSEDEISEEGLLKSRIEQQSELICILKQRADEYLKKYMEVEDQTANLRKNMEETLEKISEERNSHEILKERFKILDDNHTEMIKLKDEYKADNDRLRRQNSELGQQNKDLFSAPLMEKNMEVEKLNSEIATYQQNLMEVEKRERNLLEQLDNVKHASEVAIDELKSTLDNERSSHEMAVEKMEEKNSSLEMELSDLQMTMQESDKREKALEEKTEMQHKIIKDQDAKIDDLKKQLGKEQEKSKTLEQKYRKESEYLSTNSTIRRLNAEVEEAKKLKDKLMREFEAYKRHTTNLLNKEKELNSKLRKFHVQ